MIDVRDGDLILLYRGRRITWNRHLLYVREVNNIYVIYYFMDIHLFCY